MNTKISELENRIAKAQGARDVVTEQYNQLVSSEKDLLSQVQDLQEAKTLVQIVAEQTQKKIEFHVSNLVSTALDAIFPDPYVFELRFVQRRGKMECDLIFIKDGNESDNILLTGGGGPADITSFALRLAALSISRMRPVQILDEPFKFLSRDLQERASSMLKMVSEKFECQFIIISHIPEIIQHADTVIRIKNIDGFSIVE